MEDSFQIFTKALVCFARRDFGTIAFLVAILVSCLLPTCRRWNPLFSLHSNKRIVSINNLLVSQTKRQDCILNHHILRAMNYKGLEVNPGFHPTCVLRRIYWFLRAARKFRGQLKSLTLSRWFLVPAGLFTTVRQGFTTRTGKWRHVRLSLTELTWRWFVDICLYTHQEIIPHVS